VALFDRGWADFIEKVSIDEIRPAQADYNRYYMIEREMALPSAPPVPIEEARLLERAELLERFPPLS
jgi:hypothetical protein